MYNSVEKYQTLVINALKAYGPMTYSELATRAKLHKDGVRFVVMQLRNAGRVKSTPKYPDRVISPRNQLVHELILINEF